jgi:photosystem II stability/assembly factor-like uncharacterized protein
MERGLIRRKWYYLNKIMKKLIIILAFYYFPIRRLIGISILSTLFITHYSFSQSGWIIQNSGVSSNINAVWGFSSDTAICAGSNGVVLKTINGGANWFAYNSPANFNFDYLKFFGRDSGILACKGVDSIYITTNGGVNWILRDVNSTYYSSERKIDFPEFTTGYYFSNYIYRTTNNGLSWSAYSTSLSNLRGMSFPTSQTGWVCGTYHFPYPPGVGTNYAEVHMTTNGGANWTIQSSIQELSYSVYRVFFRDVNTGYKNDANSPSISRTVNGGSSYSQLTEFGGYLSYYFMTYSSANTGWFIGARTMKTTNGGANWTQMTTPHSATTYSGIHFANDLTGWMVGAGGIIIKTTTGGLTGIQHVSSIVPERFSLSQNYPNPFNPATNIKYQIANNKFIRLVVYDILGKEVAVLVNGKQSPGEYEVQFPNVQSANVQLPSGVYFYSLFADGERVDTKKMVLIK